jgi:hypothetical protein
MNFFLSKVCDSDVRFISTGFKIYKHELSDYYLAHTSKYTRPV